MQEYQQQVVDFLEREYNITAKLDASGGKHAKLRWTYNERQYVYAMSRNSSVPFRMVENAMSNIKKMLGPPPGHLSSRPRRKTMDELMDEVRDRALMHVDPNAPLIASRPILTPENADTRLKTATTPLTGLIPHVEIEHEPTFIPAPEMPTGTNEVNPSELTPAPDSLERELDRLLNPDIPLNPEPDDMQTPRSRTWPVTASCYRATNSPRNVVALFFPPDIMNYYKDFRIEKMDEEHWRLSPGGTRTFTSHYFGSKAKVTFRDSALPFGAMQTEAVDVDGELLIYIPLDRRPPLTSEDLPAPPMPKLALQPARKPVEPREPRVLTTQPYKPQPAPEVRVEPATPSQPAHPVLTQEQQVADTIRLPNAPRVIETTSLEEEMRTILRKVSSIESTTPYTLTRRARPDGTQRWVWEAPPIEE